MKILFVDDDKTRYDDFVYNNPNHVVDFYIPYLHEYNQYKFDDYDFIMLDHDDGVSKNFTYVANDIVRTCMSNTKIIIHSLNPFGVSRLYDILKYRNEFTLVIPNAWMFPKLIDYLIENSYH